MQIEVSTDVTSTSPPVRRELDTTQALQVTEYISASSVATSVISDPNALSANSGMQVEGVTVTENPPPPSSDGGVNVGLIVGIVIAAVAVIGGIAVGASSWRSKKRNNERAPPVEGRIAHDPHIEYGDKVSPTYPVFKSAPIFSASNI